MLRTSIRIWCGRTSLAEDDNAHATHSGAASDILGTWGFRPALLTQSVNERLALAEQAAAQGNMAAAVAYAKAARLLQVGCF